MSDAAEPEDGAKPHRPAQPFSHSDEWGYKVHTFQFDEEVHAYDLCDAEELSRLRADVLAQVARTPQESDADSSSEPRLTSASSFSKKGSWVMPKRRRFG